MDAVFGVLKTIGIVLVVAFVALFIVAMLFGKRKIRKWDFEAEFYDEQGEEFAELEIELSRWEKTEPEFSFKAELTMRHEALNVGSSVQAFVNNDLIVEGKAEKAGRIWFGNEQIVNQPSDPKAGDPCRIVVDGQDVATAMLRPD